MHHQPEHKQNVQKLAGLIILQRVVSPYKYSVQTLSAKKLLANSPIL